MLVSKRFNHISKSLILANKKQNKYKLQSIKVFINENFSHAIHISNDLHLDCNFIQQIQCLQLKSV